MTYITILRGINLGSHNVIKMEALRKVFAAAGFGNVRTYIQSGNVVFEAEATNTSELAAQVSTIILNEFGFQVPVLVLTQSEWAQIVAENPFLPEFAEDTKSLHITFLAALPDVSNIARIEAEKYLPDRFSVIGKAVYLYCPNGYGNTKLHNAFFENKLKVAATTRNWKTCSGTWVTDNDER